MMQTKGALQTVVNQNNFLLGLYLASGEDATSMPTDNLPLPKGNHERI